ncbi:MAG TPA: squalene/phytoene synthase family protein [Gemmatimonadota bacterium]|nr:squalene/phytoene synthase family protein [Gemmatimonadota bacterium]
MPEPSPAPRAGVRAERDAHAACARLAATHYENFPVRGPFLRPAERRDLAAIYAFCRTTDDLGDEAAGDRTALLAAWREQVADALAGRPPPGAPILAAVARAAAGRDLEPDLFFRLIEANVRDQTVREYVDRDALLDYCEHSATPVGRMVLGVAGAREEELRRLADHTSIGLQLANFWQDLARDRDQGRCYLPLADCRRHGVEPGAALAAPAAGAALRALVADEVGWAREHLLGGWPLADRLPLRWRPLVRAFTRGGWAICDAIERQDFDTLASRPALSRRDRTRLLLAEWARAWRTGIAHPVGRP